MKLLLIQSPFDQNASRVILNIIFNDICRTQQFIRRGWTKETFQLLHQPTSSVQWLFSAVKTCPALRLHFKTVICWQIASLVGRKLPCGTHFS